MGKRMKRINRLCLFLAAFLCLSGCGRAGMPGSGGIDPADGSAGGQEEKLKIVATIFPPYDFARQIAGGEAQVVMLLKPGMESHAYEPTPADIVEIMNSDIFLYAGGESDAWVRELLEGNDGHTRACALLDWVDPLMEETTQGMRVREENSGEETADGGVHLEAGEYDEHVWTSPKNAILLVREICQVMSECDPAHAQEYQENAAGYQKRLEQLDRDMREAADVARKRPLVFGDRFPLLYFMKTYGLEYYAAFPGCSEETEPDAAMVAFLTDKVRTEQIPVVYYMDLSDGRIAKAIAEASGAKTAVFYSGHSITAEDLKAGEDYISLMYRNVETLRAFP